MGLGRDSVDERDIISLHRISKVLHRLANANLASRVSFSRCGHACPSRGVGFPVGIHLLVAGVDLLLTEFTQIHRSLCQTLVLLGLDALFPFDLIATAELFSSLPALELEPGNSAVAIVRRIGTTQFLGAGVQCVIGRTLNALVHLNHKQVMALLRMLGFDDVRELGAIGERNCLNGLFAGFVLLTLSAGFFCQQSLILGFLLRCECLRSALGNVGVHRVSWHGSRFLHAGFSFGVDRLGSGCIGEPFQFLQCLRISERLFFGRFRLFAFSRPLVAFRLLIGNVLRRPFIHLLVDRLFKRLGHGVVTHAVTSHE